MMQSNVWKAVVFSNLSLRSFAFTFAHSTIVDQREEQEEKKEGERETTRSFLSLCRTPKDRFIRVSICLLINLDLFKMKTSIEY